MKLIPLRAEGEIRTVDVIRTVLEEPGREPIDIRALRARGSVLDLLDRVPAGADNLALGDADYATLVACVNGFGFGTGKRALLRIVDDIIEAKEPAAAPEAVE